MYDVVEWIMINQTGTVQRQITNTSNVSSTLTFTNPSDDFTSYMRCISNYILYKDVFVTKGNSHLIMFIFIICMCWELFARCKKRHLEMEI